MRLTRPVAARSAAGIGHQVMNTRPQALAESLRHEASIT